MLISQKITDAINDQIGNEFSAFLQYVAIGSHFDAEALPELSKFFYQQADEERDHAMRFVQFVNDAGGRVTIPAIAAPKAKFASAEEAVKMSLDQELRVGEEISNLVHMAKSEKDYTTDTFLHWFVKEQLEEVASMDHLLKVVHRAGEGGLLRVEEFLARRAGKLAASPDQPPA